MSFRIYAFIAVLPIFYIFAKLNKRKAMNCLDILLVFHSLYFGIIPLFCNEDFVEFTPVVNDSYVRFFAFAYYILFAFTLLVIDMFVSQKQADNLLYIGDYIKKISEKYNFCGNLAYKVLLVCVVLIFVSQGYFMSRTLMASGGSFDEKILEIKNTQSPLAIFFYGATKTIRTFATFLITLTYVQAKNFGEKLGARWKILAVFLIVNYLLNNRTGLFQGVIIISFVVYSINREFLQAKTVIKSLVAILLTVGLVFPLITAYRYNSKRLMSKVHSPVEVIIPAVTSVINGDVNMSKADNKDSRSLGVFNIFAKATDYKKEFNGYLTLCSFSHGTPKFLLPSKSKVGSQEVIEKSIGENKDVADSILLNFQLENKSLGFLLTNIFFLLLIAIYDKLNKIFFLYTNDEYLLLISISLIFPWLNQIESGIDGFLTGVFSSILLYICSTIILKVIRNRFMKNELEL